jgi:hypothetical protein
MQTTLICYADDQMTISQQLCIKSAKEVGKIDKAFSFGPNSIDKFFYQRHKHVLEAPQRGGGKGFWLWKPYIVDQAIRALPDGDILVYCDSGVEWIEPFKHLYMRAVIENYEAENDIFLFSNGHRHIDWCKKEVIERMSGREIQGEGAEFFRQQYPWAQVQASVMIFRVNQYTRDFCARWLAWSCVPGFIDDTLRGPQLPEFREHRNDQSILTNLAIEDDIKLHWWPAQYWGISKANFHGDSYPQMFYHHRYRNNEWWQYREANNCKDIDAAINLFMKANKHV